MVEKHAYVEELLWISVWKATTWKKLICIRTQNKKTKEIIQLSKTISFTQLYIICTKS